METWINKQIQYMTEDWANSISRFYPEEVETWSNPDKQYKALHERWNTLDAVKYLNWPNYLNRSGLKILDVGSGTGWLSAYLSTFNNITEIYALDSDKKNLEQMLPGIVTLMNGVNAKIKPVHGLFSPLPCENGEFDMIVASSAIHHAPNLFFILKEMKRVLKDGGELMILNEVPYDNNSYYKLLFKLSLKILIKSLKKEIDELEQTISASGILLDPKLGDHVYNFALWDKAIKKAGFNYEIINTPYYPYKNIDNQKHKLTHFRCY